MKKAKKPVLEPVPTEKAIDAAFDAIEQGLAILRGILPSSESPGDFILVVSAADVLKKLVAETLEAIGEEAIFFLQATDDRAIQNETTRWYVGTPKSTKQVASNEALVDQVWSAVGGDVASFAGSLKSNCFKPAETRSILGDDAAGLAFSVTYPDKLKDGKPQKKLATIPVAFYKRLQAEKEKKK